MLGAIRRRLSGRTLSIDMSLIAPEGMSRAPYDLLDEGEISEADRSPRNGSHVAMGSFTVESVAQTIRDGLVPDATSYLRLFPNKGLQGSPRWRGQCLLRCEGEWRPCRFDLFRLVLRVQFDGTLVALYAQLSDYAAPPLLGYTDEGEPFIALSQNLVLLFDPEVSKEEDVKRVHEKIVRLVSA